MRKHKQLQCVKSEGRGQKYGPREGPTFFPKKVIGSMHPSPSPLLEMGSLLNHHPLPSGFKSTLFVFTNTDHGL